MLYGFGAVAVVATVLISFNNPRAIFWVLLGSAKVLFCSLYVHTNLFYVNVWAPDGVFVSLIGTAIFCHVLDKYRVYEWELMLYRLVFLSLIISAAKFLNIPVISDFYGPLNIVLYAVSFILICANSLLKAGLIDSDKVKKLNRFLKSIRCNSKPLQKNRGWVERWY